MGFPVTKSEFLVFLRNQCITTGFLHTAQSSHLTGSVPQRKKLFVTAMSLCSSPFLVFEPFFIANQSQTGFLHLWHVVQLTNHGWLLQCYISLFCLFQSYYLVVVIYLQQYLLYIELHLQCWAQVVMSVMGVTILLHHLDSALCCWLLSSFLCSPLEGFPQLFLPPPQPR